MFGKRVRSKRNSSNTTRQLTLHHRRHVVGNVCVTLHVSKEPHYVGTVRAFRRGYIVSLNKRSFVTQVGAFLQQCPSESCMMDEMICTIGNLCIGIRLVK